MAGLGCGGGEILESSSEEGGAAEGLVGTACKCSFP